MYLEAQELQILMKLQEQVGEMKGTTELILAQTTKTNGTVADLQRRVDDLEKSRDTKEGAASIKKSIWSKCYALGEKIIILGMGVLFGKIFK